MRERSAARRIVRATIGGASLAMGGLLLFPRWGLYCEYAWVIRREGETGACTPDLVWSPLSENADLVVLLVPAAIIAAVWFLANWRFAWVLLLMWWFAIFHSLFSVAPFIEFGTARTKEAPAVIYEGLAIAIYVLGAVELLWALIRGIADAALSSDDGRR